jgi:hypothetical protein
MDWHNRSSLSGIVFQFRGFSSSMNSRRIIVDGLKGTSGSDSGGGAMAWASMVWIRFFGLLNVGKNEVDLTREGSRLALGPHIATATHPFITRRSIEEIVVSVVVLIPRRAAIATTLIGFGTILSCRAKNGI